MATSSCPPSSSNMTILESRSSIPLVRSFPQSPDPRLILLQAEVESLDDALANKPGAKVPGRPLTSDYTSLDQKVRFMDAHRIDISVISLANPWLDFLDADVSGRFGTEVNQEFSDMCARHPGRLFFFGTLPLTAPLDTIRASIAQLATLKYCRGVILGTSGLGNGLDDPKLLPIFEAVAAAGLTVFLHPHYGLPNAVWGPRAADYGHVLPSPSASLWKQPSPSRACTSPAGGTLPFLAGRIESCILHDGQLVAEGKVGPDRRTVWDVLKEQVYLDAVIYSEVGLKAAIDASGADRLMFGTDHPFFPPLQANEKGLWESVSLNAEAVTKAVGEGSAEAKAIMGGNAVRILRLHEEA
ncbi:hypothetical protein ACCO45_001577 [Purpureocillium lilacinum]|uniref:Uncharacterized protein n=1 Tax=Purpureocillium lilacinum TaxID=33203 RepID=A0ACC4E8B8_PURLI